MQYFKPEAPHQFVGDAMPFWSNGRFHLFYLLDVGHHSTHDGLGGHQWAHASTTDLVSWVHHPLALPLGGPGACDEHSICTGSVFEHDGTYYAFYAGRDRDANGNKRERVCVATSADLIHFEKNPANPIISPPSQYSPGDFRDPNVFRDEKGLFHMLVTTRLSDEPVHGRGGCLAHLISKDLRDWEFQEPFLIPGVSPYPECPDHFFWNGWYYLIFLSLGVNRYRMSRSAFGPWLRPEVDALDGSLLVAMKTAAFGEDRRIGVGFLPWRENGQDDGAPQYAGNAIFRELVQNPDGSLSARFPEEMVPETGEPIGVSVAPLVGCLEENTSHLVRLNAAENLAMAMMESVPSDCRVRLRVVPSPGTPEFGLCLRGSRKCEDGYELRFFPFERRVRLRPLHKGEWFGQSLLGVSGLDRCFQVDLVLKDDIIDLCVNEGRTFVNRYGEQRGDRLFFFCENGAVTFKEIDLRPIRAARSS